MKYNFYLIFLLIFLSSCASNHIYKTDVDIQNKILFQSKGFTLIYDENDYINKVIGKKINTRDYIILHSSLKKNTHVRITNLNNKKNLLAKVKFKTYYPLFYNSVISKRIAEDLDIDINNPYVEITEIQINDSFVAKKAKTYEEEKSVANKAPIEDINVKIISSSEIPSNKKKNIIYFINISDFYFEESATLLSNKLKNELSLNKIKIEKISNKKFTVYSGPYEKINKLKNDYTSIMNLGFEHLDITTK